MRQEQEAMGEGGVASVECVHAVIDDKRASLLPCKEAEHGMRMQ